LVTRPRYVAAFYVTAFVVVAALLSVATVVALSEKSVSRASAHTLTLGADGWQVQSSAKAPQPGDVISSPGYSTVGWLPVRPDDGHAPGTEINALLQNGQCPNILYSTNMKKCFGLDNNPMFEVPWWFRTDFSPNFHAGQDARLTVNGILGAADVWVNGKQIATRATIQGDYTRYTFDVSQLIRPGKNSLAVMVYENQPDTMFTVDDVNWNELAPDHNTGIQFPITLHIADGLSVSNAYVTQDDNADVSVAQLTVKADVTNHTPQSQQGTVTVAIEAPGGQGQVGELSREVTVAAGQTMTVSFTPSDYSELTINQPQLWWPYQMGAQPLYQLRTTVEPRHGSVDSVEETFAIRNVTTQLVGRSAAAPDGARMFSINGKPFQFRGGGFADDIFLHYSASDLSNQIDIIKSMGLNGIRLEGHIMPEDFYQQMDRAGIMIDGGFQCCDAWQLQDRPTPVTDQDYDVLRLSALTIGQRLRNHPSVINFSWSDDEPLPRQEQVTIDGFREAGFQAPVISSSEYNTSPILGTSGEKEGPYQWVPPTYYYDTTHFDDGDSGRTNVGGSWAFDSEEGMGQTISTQESLRRFLSPEELTQLWQNPTYNQYHANYQNGVGNYKLASLFFLDQAIAHRYGKWSNLDDYVEEAQLQNYESTRSLFEAYIDHWANRPTPATGIDFWMANKGWPSLLYMLYNNDYDQAGAYFGAKKSNEGVHALYTYDDDSVTLDNLTGQAQHDLSVQATVHDLSGTVVDTQTSGSVTLSPQEVHTAVLTPKVPAVTTAPTPATTYFVELTMRHGATVIDHNVYWRSTQRDVVDWPASLGNTQATMTQYADMQGLNTLKSLPAATLAVTAASEPGTDAQRGKTITKVTVKNVSSTPTVGFFLRADVRRGTPSGQVQPGDNDIRPSVFSDNDITLWPGESQTLDISYPTAQLDSLTPVVSVSGWNVAPFTVAAPQGEAATHAQRAAESEPGGQFLGTAHDYPTGH